MRPLFTIHAGEYLVGSHIEERFPKLNVWIPAKDTGIERRTNFIVIAPTELLRRLHAIHGKSEKRLHSYLWVTKSGCCWEARGLNNGDQEMLAFDRFRHPERDFTQFLDNWAPVEKRLK